MNPEKLIECVPNFSEGRDMEIIRQITDAIESVEGANLLDVDPGRATNRTVVTFVGTPEVVVEAAFRGITRAAELIDMSSHHGEHPRMGATDVCPLVPVAGISMDEVVSWARRLAERVGGELSIPVYLYEEAATRHERRNLAFVRSGEYEALPDKLSRKEWAPDFGPARHNPGAGATAVGARDFLIAYNVNLNTTSTRRANAIAFDVREKGRIKRDGDPLTGPVVRDENGEAVWVPGSLKSVKGIGWFIPEYGVAQVSLNLTNVHVTPLHEAFDEVCRRAEDRGVRVTGSELVGLVPLQVMLDAGRHFLRKQGRSLGLPNRELVRIAVRSLGLDDLSPFDPDQKIIEYRLRDSGADPLVALNLEGFADETASESPAPGGGSVAAYVGALGAALGTMVANLSSHKRGWDDRWEEFSEWAVKGEELKQRLLQAVDEDTRAFNSILEAYRLPDGSDEEREKKAEALADANRRAIETPFQVMELALASMDVAEAMARTGNPASVSDAGVGALCARAAVLGAYLNVRINASGQESTPYLEAKLAAGAKMAEQARRGEDRVIQLVEAEMATGQ